VKFETDKTLISQAGNHQPYSLIISITSNSGNARQYPESIKWW